MRHLSGWVRLWIVFALLTWALVAWLALTAIGLPPDASASDHTVCLESWRASGSPIDSPWLTDCPRDPVFVQAARSAHDIEAANYPYRLAGFVIPGALIPLYVLVVFATGKWIWRGFRPKAGS